MPTDLATVPRAAVNPDDPAQIAIVLTVVEGPDTGKSFVIDASQPQRALLGNSETCTFRLRDPQVSRRHLAVELAPPRLRITDTGSTNGTFVDGVALLDGYVRGGEIIRIGQTALRVDRGLSPQRALLPDASGFGRVVGRSLAMRRLYPLCERLAASNVPVIIEGETGTGKEMLAEALHEMGPRASGPFVVFDCTAVAPNLLESELFGHERGAYTGAHASRKGVFEQAHTGTLLIDEIGDLELPLQSKLLRAIERSEVRRVGGDRTIRVDVRVLSATRRNLDEEVAAGRFRDDLFHRLAVARIELPPLRMRTGDVATLVHHFWRALGGAPEALSPSLLARFEASAWPGNVRELRNAIARRIALGDLEGAPAPAPEQAAHAPPPGPESPDDFWEALLALDLPYAMTKERLVSELESRYVARILEKHGGNVSQAASAAGLARRYFQLLRSKQGR